MKLIVLLLLATSAFAEGERNYRFKKEIDPVDCLARIRASGVSAASLSCDESDMCGLMDVVGDPLPAIATCPAITAKQNNRDAAIALVVKLRAGTITAAEQRELLGRLAYILLAK